MNSRIILTFLFLLLAGLIVISTASTPQKRDHLTQHEIDLVKEAQALDKRIDVFIKAAERRLMVLSNSSAAHAKQLKKDTERWGELPTGSRAELIGDIARIFDEAITNIDDVSARDQRNPLIPKSLRKLAQGVNTIMAQLKTISADVKSEAELASLELLHEDAQSILEAASRLPPEVDKKAKKNK